MKVVSMPSQLLQFDVLRKRIDLGYGIASLCVGLIVGWWVAYGFAGTQDLLARIMFGTLFAVLVCVLVGRLKASRLASIGLLLVVMAALRSLGAADMALLSVYTGFLVLVQEYFLIKRKLVALIVSALVGVLAAMAGSYAGLVLFLFISALVARLLWHAVIERLGKKQFVLFGAKVVAMSVVAPLMYLLFTDVISLSALPKELPAADLPVWLLVVLGLFVLRGAWATVLLRTPRSPKHRGLRMFYALFGLSLLALIYLMQRYGDDVFLPNILSTLANMGLTQYNLGIGSFVLLAAMAMFTAAIDRSLYKDAWLARKYAATFLGRPFPPDMRKEK